MCLPVVVVEDHDGSHHTAGHHEHDAVEVGPCDGTDTPQLLCYPHFCGEGRGLKRKSLKFLVKFNGTLHKF